MTRQMPVVKLETAPTGLYKLASAYADCQSEMRPLYNVESEVASSLVEERCGPIRARLQAMVNKMVAPLRDLPQDGPVVVFIRALALLAVVRKGKLRFL